MRLNLWLILVALISACAPPPQQRSTKPTATQRLQALAAQGDPVLGKFAWLAGTWAGRDLGPLSLEVWEQPHGGVLLGHHQDVDGAFTPYFSYLRIEAHADGVALHVHPQGGEAVTYRIVETGPQMVVFANVNQSFPRRIVYGRSGDVLKVHQDGTEGRTRKSFDISFRCIAGPCQGATLEGDDHPGKPDHRGP